MSSVEVIRSRVQTALGGGPACPQCGHQEPGPLAARELARRVGIKPGVLRRFAKGEAITTPNLERIERGLDMRDLRVPVLAEDVDPADLP